MVTFKTFHNVNIIKLSTRMATFSILEAEVGTTIYDETYEEQIGNTNYLVMVNTTQYVIDE